MEGFIDGATIKVRSPKFKSYNAMVSPATAKAWLGTERLNRNLQRTASRGYRNDMNEGRWEFAGDPIRFDIFGNMVDGKNRMTALSGIEIEDFELPFVVQVGHAPTAQKVMDQGARRTAGQQLQLAGHQSGTYIAAGYKLKVLWERKELFLHGNVQTPVTTQEILEWIAENEETTAAAMRLLHVSRTVGLRPSAALAVIIRICEGGYEDEITALLHEVRDLVNLPPGAPAATLAKRLRTAKNSDRARTLDLVDHLAFLTQTWNSWVNNKTRQSLQRPTVGWTLDNLPELDI